MADIEIDITSAQQEQPDIDVHPVYGPKGANGANGRAATIEVGTVRTGAAGTTAIITNSGDSSNAVFNFTIPKGDTGEQGIQGETGATGNGIETIEKTSTSGLVDTYTITYTDDTTSTFTLTNGQNGANATITGATASVDNSTGTPSVVVTAGGSESARSFNFAFSNLKGSKGEQGIQGETGVSVTGVTLLSTVGLDKTYRMTFSDNTYFDYVVSNGASGSTEWGGISGVLSNQTDLQSALNGKYDSSNPNGYTSNIGTVTSVNNITPVNGNVTLEIPDNQIQSDWNEADTTSKAYIKNKPTNLANIDLSNLSSTGLDVIIQNGGVPPQPVSNPKVYTDGSVYKLIWTDPDDITAGGYDFYEWDKTVIVAKVGSYPTSPTDGTVVVTETTKNSYSATYYSWTPQTFDDYYFRAFCYSTKGYYSKTDDNKFVGLAPAAISNGLTHKTSTGYQLKWNDPASGDLLSWAATYIIRKEGNYPESITDGIQVLKSTTRNAYSSTPYLDVVPDITKNYYYRAYTYSTNNLYNDSIDNQFSEVTPDTAVDCFVDNTSHSYPELIWSDPADKTFCTWEKTVIVRKMGSAPTTPTDGDVIYTETIKNNHSDNTNPYVDTTAQSGVTYYYKAFPCSTNGVYNTSSDTFVYKSIYSQIYEFIINTAESEPTAAVTYAGANASYTPASMNFSTGAINYGSWGDAFFQPRPVMVKYDGTVDYELSKSDFTKKADGVTASDVANTSYNGNCMIAFPQIWMKFVQDDATHQHVYIADTQVDNDYHCYTHQNKNGDWLNEIFIMAFEPSNISNKLRSLAGQTILQNLSGETMQSYAKANGSAWDFMDYGELQMLQMLCILMFKSLNVQSKIGAGVVYSGNSYLTYATTGSTKDKGMFYSICNDPTSASATTAIKVFGIENLWDNRFKWINGLVIPKTSSASNTATIKYKLCDYTTDGSTVAAYSQAGTGYKTLTTFAKGGTQKSGYINKMILNSDGLFATPDNISGSDSTYYSDYAFFGGSNITSYNLFARFGGYYGGGSFAGLFNVTVGNQLALSNYDYGASLSCKPL